MLQSPKAALVKSTHRRVGSCLAPSLRRATAETPKAGRMTSPDRTLRTMYPVMYGCQSMLNSLARFVLCRGILRIKELWCCSEKLVELWVVAEAILNCNGAIKSQRTGSTTSLSITPNQNQTCEPTILAIHHPAMDQCAVGSSRSLTLAGRLLCRLSPCPYRLQPRGDGPG